MPLQLRAARYEVYDIFFSLSAGERMQLISWDRELARERELRRQVTFTGTETHVHIEEEQVFHSGIITSEAKKDTAAGL